MVSAPRLEQVGWEPSTCLAVGACFAAFTGSPYAALSHEFNDALPADALTSSAIQPVVAAREIDLDVDLLKRAIPNVA
jgi:hypothetical protein